MVRSVRFPSLTSSKTGGGTLGVDLSVNFAARFWSAAAGLIAVPAYLSMLGLEQYGLLGFYTTLQGVLLIFDLSLGAALARELARAPRPLDDAARDLARTFSCSAILIAGGIALLLVLLAPWVADGWLRAGSLDPDRLRLAVELLALALAASLPPALYHQGLVGMGLLVMANAVQIVFITLRTLGAIAAMSLLGATPEVFFAWQIACGIGQALVGALLLRQALGPGPRRYRLSLLRAHQRYAIGMTGAAAFMTLYGAADRLVLSSLLPLDEFGLYSLAVTAAWALSMLTSPVASAFLPRFARASNDPDQLEAEYFRSSRLASVLLTPFALVLALFGGEALHAWTGHPSTGELRLIVSLLALTSYCCGLMHLSIALQSGVGRMRFVLEQYALSLFIGSPIMAVAAYAHGALGAAAVLFLVQLAFLFVASRRVHESILTPGSSARWCRRFLLIPFCAAAGVTLLIRVAWDGGIDRLTDALGVGGACVAALAAVLVVDRWIGGESLLASLARRVRGKGRDAVGSEGS